MLEESERSFKFEVDKVGSDVDENGDVEVSIRHDGEFAKHVMSCLDVDEFNEEMISEFLVRLVYSSCTTKRN